VNIENRLKINNRDIKLLSLLGKRINQADMAELCGLMQPRVSKRIESFEHELGAIMEEVEDRVRRDYRRQLTTNGERIVAIAEKIDALFDELYQYRKVGIPNIPKKPLTPLSIASELRQLASVIESSVHGR
jgi:dynactin complex subunit